MLSRTHPHRHTHLLVTHGAQDTPTQDPHTQDPPTQTHTPARNTWCAGHTQDTPTQDTPTQTHT